MTSIPVIDDYGFDGTAATGYSNRRRFAGYFPMLYDMAVSNPCGYERFFFTNAMRFNNAANA